MAKTMSPRLQTDHSDTLWSITTSHLWALCVGKPCCVGGCHQTRWQYKHCFDQYTIMLNSRERDIKHWPAVSSKQDRHQNCLQLRIWTIQGFGMNMVQQQHSP
ncbi:hypothetical protein ABBQ32_14220 [Trebouxia sp. C0010 RCD-2024]